MNERTRRIIKRAAAIFACIYLAGGICIYFLQDRLLFHPSPLPSSHVFSFDDPFKETNIPFGKENLNMLCFPTAEEQKGIVLFFHGNAENVQHYKQYPFLFTRSGYEVWMPDYPGFGKSTGPRSEKIMEEQALLVYQLARKRFPADSIVLYGKSMGTGVASWLAAHYPCRQLILETP